MKLIIAGSRDIVISQEQLHEQITKRFPNINEIVSGLANGPDTIGLEYAKLNNIQYKEFPADWKTYGKAAGMIRNRQMGDYADALLAFWNEKSRGTKGMINYMKTLKKPYHVVLILDNQLDL